MINRKNPPATSLIAPLPFLTPEKSVLSNGVPVYIVDGGTEDIIKVEILFEAGGYNEPKPLVALSTATLLKSGTKTKNQATISETLDFFGAFLQIDAQKDIISASVFVLKKHLEPILELFKEIIIEPVFANKELELFLQNQKNQHITSNSKVAHLARRHFVNQLFGNNHPYGQIANTTDFDKVSREDLLTFHQQWLQPQTISIIVSGKLPSNISELIERHFGANQWLMKENLQPEPFFQFSENKRKKLLIPKEDALQSAIRIGKRTINRNQAAHHKLVITNALLGGFFGSRLMRNIRQDKGFTYGINSGLVSLVRDGYFFVGTEVGVDVCKAAIDQIYHEMKALRTIPASPQELHTLKNYLAGNFVRLFDGPFAQAERFKEMVVFKLEPSYYNQFLLELNQCSPETIMQTAHEYLHEDSLTEVVAGKY